MKINRFVSFLIIIAIYALASAVGIYTYLSIPGKMWFRLLIADVAGTIITFIFSILFKNSSVYDPYWSVQPIIILFAFIFNQMITLPKLLIVIAISFWGIRLTANWAYTFGGMAHQDWRYTMLKEKTGFFYPIINFLGIHLVPTLVVYACTLPAVFVVTLNTTWSPLCLIGFAISIGAVILQSVADIQMHQYRKNKSTPFIETGLWKYSRHPNYLAEILMWYGIAFFAIALLGFKWYFILGAIANTILFFAVSIPMADGRQSKKPGFEQYKAKTRMLLPIKRFK